MAKAAMYRKAIVAALTGVAATAAALGFEFGLTETLINAIAGVVSTILVWRVPNK